MNKILSRTDAGAPRRPRVVLGLLGTRLDGAQHADRWAVWRPSLSVLMQADWTVDRFELLYEPAFAAQAEFVMQDMRTVSPQTEVRGREVPLGANPWDFESVYDALLGFARTYAFDPEAEEYFIHITTGTHVAQICLFLLAESGDLPAKLLQSAPRKRAHSTERATGSIDIIDLDLSRYDRLATRFAKEQAEARDFLKSGIATRNAAFNTLIDRIEQVALCSCEPVLLTGPTGAGKSQLARRIHELRKQRTGLKGKFVEVNCATLRGDAAMSALFGHVKGAFTGAVTDRAGLLREADGGLLFLDEIGELGADEQAMLLRAVEDRIFNPYGSDRMVRSDFQLIAGTNCDLHALVNRKEFREDLHARINLWTFELPGLAERREDIAPNLDYELERASVRLGRRISMNREAREAFLRFAVREDAVWRGNFRDLNAAVLRMATLAPKGRIGQETAEEEIARLQRHWRRLDAAPPSASAEEDAALVTAVLGRDCAARYDALDLATLTHVLRVCRHSRSLAEAGRKLYNITRGAKAKSNDTDRVRKFLARFGLTWDAVSLTR